MMKLTGDVRAAELLKAQARSNTRRAVRNSLLAALIIGGSVFAALKSFAADLPVKASAYAAPVPYLFDWSSVFLEANAGWIGSSQNNSVDFLGLGSGQGTSTSGFAGGGGIGVQKEFGGWFVLGVDARIWDIATSGTVNAALAGNAVTLQNSGDLLYLGLVSAGVAFGSDGTWLFSGEVGVAANKSGVSFTVPGIAATFQNSAWNGGWAAGARLDKAWNFGNGFALSTGLEYLHISNTGINSTLSVGAVPVVGSNNSTSADFFGANLRLLFNGSSRT